MFESGACWAKLPGSSRIDCLSLALNSSREASSLTAVTENYKYLDFFFWINKHILLKSPSSSFDLVKKTQLFHEVKPSLPSAESKYVYQTLLMLSTAGFDENKTVFFCFDQDCDDARQDGLGVLPGENGCRVGGGVRKSLLPSAARRKINPNNFIGIIASE